jgi:hypothetical protein
MGAAEVNIPKGFTLDEEIPSDLPKGFKLDAPPPPGLLSRVGSALYKEVTEGHAPNAIDTDAKGAQWLMPMVMGPARGMGMAAKLLPAAEVEGPVALRTYSNVASAMENAPVAGLLGKGVDLAKAAYQNPTVRKAAINAMAHAAANLTGIGLIKKLGGF